MIPDSLLLKLWMAHVTEGRELLTKPCPDEPGTMFVSKSGRPFNACTLVQYWKKVMADTCTMEYFPPGKARNIFCDEFRRVHGHEPDLEEGAAAIMGNSPEQWTASYTPSRKRHLSQAAADVVADAAASESDSSEEAPVYYPSTPSRTLQRR